MTISKWRRLQLLIFFTEVIKFYLLMLLLYPGELYRLLGASSLYSSLKSLNVICKCFCLAVTVPKIQGGLCSIQSTFLINKWNRTLKVGMLGLIPSHLLNSKSYKKYSWNALDMTACMKASFGRYRLIWLNVCCIQLIS
jgi:hypothetical protein